MEAAVIKSISEAGNAKVIPSHPEYKIDDSGNIYSSWTFGGYSNNAVWKLLKPYLSSGYLRVNLWDGSKYAKKFVHRIMLETFVGNSGKGEQACHNNGDRLDNRIENLRWDSSKNNNADKKEHGTWQGGVNNPASKLTDKIIRVIKWANLMGAERKYLANMFGVSRSTIDLVVNGKIWKHILIN